MRKNARRVVIGIAAVLALAASAYAGMLVYVLYFWKPQLSVPKEVSDVMASDIIAWVPEASGPIEVVWRGERRHESFPDRPALSKWLCEAHSRGRTAVLLHEARHARGLLEMQLVELSSPAFALPCAQGARFYAVRDRASGPSHEQAAGQQRVEADKARAR